MNIYTNELTQNTKQGKSFNARINKVNDVVFYGDTSQITIPSEYQQVEYLEGSGTASGPYIDTGIEATPQFHFQAHLDILSNSSYTCGFVMVGSYVYNGLYKKQLEYNYRGAINANKSNFTIKQTIEGEKLKVVVLNSDNSTQTAEYDIGTPTGTNGTFHIFRSPSRDPQYMRVYYFKLFNESGLVRDFIPCYRKSDNVAGLYDLVSNTFFVSPNNSIFTVGSDVSAPSPNHPANIKNITGENTISLNGTDYDLDLGTIELAKIGNYQDTLFKASGKNLFDNSKVEIGKSWHGGSNTTRARFYIEMTPGTEYSIRVDDFTNFNEVAIVETATITSGTAIYTEVKTAPFTTTHTLSSGAIYLCIQFQSSITFTQTMADSIKLMLNLGSTALPYEPYGNYWYKKEIIGKTIFDGTEEIWRIPGSNNDNIVACNLVNTAIYDFADETLKQYFNSFKWITNKSGWSAALNSGVGAYTYIQQDIYKYVYFVIPKTIASDLAGWLTWLSNNNLIAYYVKAIPTYERIIDEQLLTQLQAIENMSGNGTLTSTIELKISYDENVNYETNGEGFLTDTLEAEVVEQLNGDYYLDFSYKLDGALSEYLKEENVIKCKVANGSKQLFRIKRVVKDFDTIEVYAQHIFYDLLNNFLLDTAPTNLNAAAFGTWVLNHTNYPTYFTFLSDIVDTKSARYVRRNPVEAFIGDIDNSMTNLFGGDLERNNFTINLKSQMGVSDGIKLLFGKNIKDIKITSDYSSIITRILPLGFDGLMLPEVYVDSPLIGNYETPKIAKIEFSDIKYDPESEEEGVYTNIEDAYTALRNACNDLYSQGVDLPLINIKIDWVELSKTNEYRNYQALETLHLGDYITAEILGLNYKTRVIKINYNPLTDMIDNFEIGSIQSNIGTSINANTKRVESINISSILQSAQDNATTQITTAMGGYVYKTHNELYIMDTDDTSTAQKVWRWNLNGLGYSENGINGPYNLAMTQDGQIVANFITTGTMDVSRIAGLEQVVLTVDTIKNDYFDSDGNALSVKTSKGFTFDSDGLNISDSETGFNTTIDETGTFYKEGNTILSQTTKDNTITKDLVLYGKYYYGVNENLDVENFTKDDAMFVGQLYTDSNNEEGFGHFWNSN